MNLNLDTTSRRLLAEIELRFPITHRPFAVVGQAVGIGEEEALERVTQLKHQQAIRRISALFDVRSLGYQTTLAAMRVDPARATEAVRAVQQHPGVLRIDRYQDVFNLWFTIAVPPSDSFDQTLAALQASAGASETLVLPILQAYKTRKQMDVRGTVSAVESGEDIYEHSALAHPKPQLRSVDLALIRAFQEELPLIEMPYVVLAEQAGVDEAELFAWAQEMEHQGLIRRMAAVPQHPASPASSRLLAVWRVPEDEIDPIGQGIARLRHVEQCDHRPSYAQWPYTLYTGICGESHDECLKAVEHIEAEFGAFAHKNLVSLATEQRERLIYFPAELERWWQHVEGRRPPS